MQVVNNRLAPSEMVVDPAQIQKPSQIPPAGSNYLGLSGQKLVDVYNGTLPGDVDAQPAAKELLGTSPDTGGQSNADYVYNQVSALYKAQLPDFVSPSGNNVRSVVFVSGSSQGGFGAFHIPGPGGDFDRIVVDSLNAAGGYSAGSGLTSIAPVSIKIPHLFPIFRGADELLSVTHQADPRLKSARPTSVHDTLMSARQSAFALTHAVVAASLTPTKISSGIIDPLTANTYLPETYQLANANRDIFGLVASVDASAGGRQFLSTALLAAEIVECFQKVSGKGNPGRTDGESVSRVVTFKLTPEIALVPGFNTAVTQQWWNDGFPDFVNDNSQDDQSVDGNGAGVMFLEFLIDYLGVPLDRVLERMPSRSGAPLGETYVSLLTPYPELAKIAGSDGIAAFQKMVSLLQQYVTNPDGTLNLPADGNPFNGMPGAKHDGRVSGPTPDLASLARDAQSALSLETQLDQQMSALKATIQQIQTDLAPTPASGISPVTANQDVIVSQDEAVLRYGPPLVTSVAASLEQRVASYRAPQYDQTLQQDFWPHVYNELPGTGTRTDRLQVITGTNRAPVAVQIAGTIKSTKCERDGDLHIAFQPDDPSFPANQDPQEPPLELEIIYACLPVRQVDAQQAELNYTNPFDTSQLGPGTRILAAGPLIFDTAHGRPASDGTNVDFGLEIHPLAGMTLLSPGAPIPPSSPPIAQPVPPPTTPSPPPTTQPGPPSPAPLPTSTQLSTDLTSALGQLDALGRTVGNLSTLLQKMKEEAP